MFQKLIGTIKQNWANYLKRLEKANKEVFKGKKPDCCSLNKPDTRKGA